MYMSVVDLFLIYYTKSNTSNPYAKSLFPGYAKYSIRG